MAKPAGSFTVALGEDLKKRLVAAAQAAGSTPSVLARRAMAEALRDEARDCSPPMPARPGEPFNEIRVKVPQSAAARLAAAAGAAGMTRSAYVSAATVELAERSAAHCGVTAPMRGIEAAGTLREALVKSTASLAPIGRNLNQVARSLNTYPSQVSLADRENLAEVAHRVFEHLELASELLHAIRAPRTRAKR